MMSPIIDIFRFFGLDVSSLTLTVDVVQLKTIIHIFDGFVCRPVGGFGKTLDGVVRYNSFS